MQIEAYDEILSPQRCARCGRAFSPPPDPLVFCPDCHAAHVGLRLPPGVLGGALAKAWMKSFTGEDCIHSGSGFTTHQTNGQLFIVHGAQASRGASGYATMVERGEARAVSGPKYAIFRVAGFCPRADPRALGPHLASPYGAVGRKPWGLELVVEGAAREAIEARGYDTVLAELAALAQASGYEPVLETSDADVAQLPPQVSATLEARQERAIRCASCGAPSAPADVGASGRCPYCLSPIRVPPELAHELERHRRQLRAHDAQFSLRGASFWDGLRSARGNAWLACAVCGAPREHRPGAVDEACGHCGAMTVPSAQRLQSDVGSARDELSALKARREAAARAQMDAGLRTARTLASVNVALVVGGTLVTLATSLPLVLLAAGTDASSLMRIAMMLFMLGVWPFAAFLYGIYAFRRNARQRRQWRPVWAAVADQLDGLVSPNPRAWLSRFWSASLPIPSWVRPSHAKGAVEAVYEGIPVMIEGDPEGRVGPLRQMYGGTVDLRIYIAVDWPETVGVLKAMRGIRERRRQLSEAGFGTCIHRRGFELRASSAVLGRLLQQPEQTVAVVPVLFEALRIVKLLGGQGVRAQ